MLIYQNGHESQAKSAKRLDRLQEFDDNEGDVDDEQDDHGDLKEEGAVGLDEAEHLLGGFVQVVQFELEALEAVLHLEVAAEIGPQPLDGRVGPGDLRDIQERELGDDRAEDLVVGADGAQKLPGADPEPAGVAETFVDAPEPLDDAVRLDVELGGGHGLGHDPADDVYPVERKLAHADPLKLDGVLGKRGVHHYLVLIRPDLSLRLAEGGVYCLLQFRLLLGSGAEVDDNPERIEKRVLPVPELPQRPVWLTQNRRGHFSRGFVQINAFGQVGGSDF